MPLFYLCGLTGSHHRRCSRWFWNWSLKFECDCLHLSWSGLLCTILYFISSVMVLLHSKLILVRVRFFGLEIMMHLLSAVFGYIYDALHNGFADWYASILTLIGMMAPWEKTFACIILNTCILLILNTHRCLKPQSIFSLPLWQPNRNTLRALTEIHCFLLSLHYSLKAFLLTVNAVFLVR